MPDYKQLCAELVHLNDHPDTDHAKWSEAIDRVRAALAAEPQGEVAELVARLLDFSTDLLLQERSRAADLLERQQPMPVPVSERLPGPEDCDAEGKCWWFCFGCSGEHSYWILAKEVYCGPACWLPAHALPLPITTETTDD